MSERTRGAPGDNAAGGKAGRSKAVREFVSEAEDILERMRAGLADLNDARAANAEPEPDLVNRLFRSAHSLKGLAGMFGLDAMSELSHHLEDVLDGMRLGRVSPASPAAALLDESVARMASLLEAIGDSEAESRHAEAVHELVSRIEQAVRAPASPAGARDELAGLDLDPALLRALTEYEEHRLRESVRRGRRIVLVESTFEILAFEEGLAELTHAVRQVGEVLSTLPAPGDAPESQIRFTLIAASDLTPAALAARLEFPSAQVRALGGPVPAAAPQATASRSLTPAQDAAGAGDEAGEAVLVGESPNKSDGLESLKSISDTVRVDIRKLDELMNLVGELVIQRGALAQIAARLAADPATARIAGELVKVQKAFERKFQELQTAVLDVRMVPLRQVFEKLSRVVRRLRRDLHKEVRFEIRGADTELDKLLVEELVDPLVHLVRNAFDHAIESPAERKAAGKPPEGRISIEASQRGSHVVIQVNDDGRGIDAPAVRARAELRGLVARGDLLSHKETLDLVFAPGLSTRSAVTATSGRGVGMDVVRANLNALGGMVDLESAPGRGTQITLTLPITLAIIPALVVGVGEQRFAIPLNSVLETLLVDPSEIQRSEGRELLNLRGQPLLLRRLAREFELPEPRDASKSYVVVLGLGDARVGLVVERLHGQQDAVIKPIQGPIQNLRGVTGATEFGDQLAVLVLDVSALVDDGVLRREVA